MTAHGNTIKKKVFQAYLQSLSKRERQRYSLYREGIRKRIPLKIPDKYKYLYLYDVINLHYIPQEEEAIQELIYVYYHLTDRETPLSHQLASWIGDMYLTIEEPEEACQWYHISQKKHLINYLLSYYNYEKGLEKMPLRYWSNLYEKKNLKGASKGEVLDQFFQTLAYVNSRLEEDLGVTLLEYLNLRPRIRFFHERFHQAIYGGPRMYLMDPYKKFLHYQRMTQVLEQLFLYSRNQVKKPFFGENSYQKEWIPKRIRSYLAELNILQIIGEKRQIKPKKKVILDEEKIEQTLFDQMEMVKELKSLMAEEEMPAEPVREPIEDIQDLFESNQKSTLDPPRLSPQEKRMVAVLLKGNISEKTLKESLAEKSFIHQTIDDLNEKLYPYIGSPLIEKEGKNYFIHEENQFQLKELNLTSQEEI